jgi:DNA-binding MarR family transcriptional regulator
MLVIGLCLGRFLEIVIFRSYRLENCTGMLLKQGITWKNKCANPLPTEFCWQSRPKARSSPSDLGAALGISSEAARQQLTKMAEEGLVEAVTEAASGRGRPRQLWHLTATGNGQFPDGHAELTANLLTTLVAQLGPQALDAVIAAREEETLKRYRNRGHGARSACARPPAGNHPHR